MSVGRICIREVDTASPQENVLDVARRMRDRQVGTVVIVDDQGRPMGLLSDRDVTVRIVAAGRDAIRTPVEEAMTPMPTVVLEDTPIEAALGHMRTGRMRRLPVVNGAGKLLGIVTLDDVIGLLVEEFALIGGLLRREAPHRAA
ncbi:MAG: CBS domain-containing protein [Candidatus Binatia bacterium]